jgi:IS30 family transposase
MAAIIVTARRRPMSRPRRLKHCKLAANPWPRQAVAEIVRLYWSLEQIAGRPKGTHPEGGSCQVSHETIYRS